MRVIRDERHTRKTPRWWAVAPPTPAEAPQAKRRTAARSRGSIALIVTVIVAFVVSALLLFFRVGRQVGSVEPVVASLRGSAPVAPGSPVTVPVSPPSAPVGKVPEITDGAAPTLAPSAAPSARSRPAREVFRKPGF